MGCGVSAAINLNREPDLDIFKSINYILEESKNRGQQASGGTLYREGELIRHKGKGLPHEVFTQEFRDSHDLRGEVGIGHVRYATEGGDNLDNAHPVRVKMDNCTLDFAMNGEISDHLRWRENLEEKGINFDKSTNDASTFAGLILDNYLENPDLLKSLSSVYDEVFDYGGFTAVGLLSDDNKDKNYFFYERDGLRPFYKGKFRDSLVFASEDSPLYKLSATDIREVESGIIGVYDIDSGEFETAQKKRVKPLCFFEIIYEMRPDSTVNGRSVIEYRYQLGKQLREEHPPETCSKVTWVPRSGQNYARGYSKDVQEILIKDPSAKYARTFMVSQDSSERLQKARTSFLVVRDRVEGNNIVTVDDSIVRYNNTPVVVNLLREYGAHKVYTMIGCPPIIGPCHAGIDTHPEELITNVLGLDPMEIAGDHTELEKELENYVHPKLGEVRIDGVGYLSVDALKNVCGDKCYGCVEGIYPYKFKDMDKTLFRFEPV
ncbi:MAG: hypothetical protein KAT28_03440 [Candidatus Aenigmarchaeota archaeon]|nr:hypothetical protein [Candidatus Aenigmarchaeota archaeon]